MTDPVPGKDTIAIVVLKPEHMIADPVLTGSELDKCSTCGQEVWLSSSGRAQREAWAARGGVTELHCCCCVGFHSVEEMRSFIGGSRKFEVNGEEAEVHIHDFAAGDCTCGMKGDWLTTATNEVAARLRDEEQSKVNFSPDNIQDL